MARSPRLQSTSLTGRALAGLLIGLGVALFCILVRPTQTVENIELGFVDARTRHYVGTRPPDERIVLAEILEHDIAAVMQALAVPWPWSLEYNAIMFDLMHKADVDVVVIDVLHLDRGQAADDFAGSEAVGGVEAAMLEAEASAAELYGAALKEVGSVALAYQLSSASQYEVEARLKAARPGMLTDRLVDPPTGIERPAADLPVSRVSKGAAALGFANVDTDSDGVVRRAQTVGRWDGRPVASLPLAAALLEAGGSAVFADGVLQVGEARQEVMADGSFLVNFRGRPNETYPRLAPSQVLEWAMQLNEAAYAEDEEAAEAVVAEARARLEGKIVVWGYNPSGAKDIVTSPTSGSFHGPEFQATVIDNLLHGDGRVRAAKGLGILLVILLAALCGVLGRAMAGRILPHVIPVLVGVAYVATAWLVFGEGTSLDMFTPLLALFLTWGGTTGHRLLTEGRRNRWLEGTFGRYLAPSIIEALKKDPGMLVLGGRRRPLTILFSDVAGFTSLSERLTPEQVVQLLNTYLTAHSAAVMEEGGVVDKFEGDAVMAFWGDPVPDEDHALAGCRTALKVIRRLPELEPVWRGMGLEGFTIRIGLNTGDAIVGNMGSSQRFDYTCMGDSVNLASRLEGANKAFGSIIMIGPGTREATGDAVVAKPLARVQVVGKGEPVQVYELLGLAADGDEDLAAHAKAFEAAQEAARAGDLETAARHLDEAEARRPGDGPVAWFRGVLEAMREGREPTPWSGELRLTAK